MKNNKLFVLSFFILAFALFSSVQAQNTGATPCDAINLYPAAIGNCNNTCGQQLCGQYQCETAACGNNTMPGTATIDGSCTPDNDIGQACTWLEVTATAADLVVENQTNYSGQGAGNIERKDYTLFSGSCGSLTEVDCQANVAINNSVTFSGLTVGQTYFIQVTRSQVSINTGCPSCNSASSCIQSSVPHTASNSSCATATTLLSSSTINSTNANATANNNSVCQSPSLGSVENNVWYEWCSGPSWLAGDTAFVHIFNQTCNNSQGLQMSVYDATTTCAAITSGTASSQICENPGTTTDYSYYWIANPNECFFLTLDGFAGTACNFDIQVSAYNTVILLKNELIHFAAENLNKSVVLNWEIKTNSSTSTFSIERSSDAIHFNKLGTVEPGLHQQMYHFTDQTPLPAVSYYRLKMIAYDGTISYSKIVAINRKDLAIHDKFYIHNVYPQPFNDMLNIDFEVATSSAVNLKIVNTFGQVIIEKRYPVVPSSYQSIALDLKDIEAGIYTLILEDKNLKIARMERVVKQ
ncbi:T9SS type A sorting domain-containing protein [Aureispira anguillae]|uniref:T9SS type A sorting domain-containing protein n=1 Tax=Aureispira anguillae TaxID=2864201 RepID=A0A915YKG9_9BACT|nr:T9SS type A sorting domain-containing protein [Aureispira anguillae]BDS14882.1 T9SS type A sorting domain-containing protein [Aureispira anguillae]